MEPGQFRQPPVTQTGNIGQEELPGLLREDLLAETPENVHTESHFRPHRLYAILDMSRIEGDLREEVMKKLTSFRHDSLMDDDPRFEEFKPHSAWLAWGNGSRRDDRLLDEFGGCDSNLVSAWIVSALSPEELAAHFKRAAFAWNDRDQRFLLRYYDPLITPVLHQLAAREWVDWFWGPLVAWWYPVATPMQETWSRIAGGAKTAAPAMVKLMLTDELMEGLNNDPFAHRLLTITEQQLPAAVFESNCYGVRLAKIEALIEAARKQGLKENGDIIFYVLGLLESPARADEPAWQAAVMSAAAGQAPLKSYFPSGE